MFDQRPLYFRPSPEVRTSSHINVCFTSASWWSWGLHPHPPLSLCGIQPDGNVSHGLAVDVTKSAPAVLHTALIGCRFAPTHRKHTHATFECSILFLCPQTGSSIYVLGSCYPYKVLLAAEKVFLFSTISFTLPLHFSWNFMLFYASLVKTI